MTELERYRQALAFAECNFKSIASYPGTFGQQAENALQKIAAILNPPPEVETVEVSAGWVNIYEQTATPGRLLGMYTFATKDEADKEASKVSATRIDCQEIKAKIQRPKPQKVVKRVSVEAKIGGASGYVITMQGDDFKSFPECHGKTGTLTFEWEEA